MLTVMAGWVEGADTDRAVVSVLLQTPVGTGSMFALIIHVAYAERAVFSPFKLRALRMFSPCTVLDPKRDPASKSSSDSLLPLRHRRAMVYGKR